MKDPENGELYYIGKFVRFGFDSAARVYNDIPDCTFKDKAENNEAMLLAIEALLVFGSYYC